jgi:hypothetical protein
MSKSVPRLRLRSLTGLALISGFSLIVWIAVVMGVAQLTHANHPTCDHNPTQAQIAQGCKPQ